MIIINDLINGITCEKGTKDLDGFVEFLALFTEEVKKKVATKEMVLTKKGLRILVMDDEEIVADIAQQMLTHLGYEVDVVKNGNDAIEAYRGAYGSDNPFVLVIMDLNIPGGMGGLEAVQGVLQINSGAKVIVSTGYSSDPILDNFAKHGFCGCIAKPFDLESIRHSVHSVLSL